MAIFVIDLFLQSSKRRIAIIAISSIGFLVAAAFATHSASVHPYLADGQWFTPMQRPVGLFYALMVLDPWAILFEYLSWVIAALAIWMAAPSLEISSERMGEYCALLLSIPVGLSLMASSTDMLMIVIGVELVSLVSYALAGFKKHDRKSSEAALKYVVYGGVASGMMLFGMSYLFGLLGSTNLAMAGPQLRQYGERIFVMGLESGQFGAGQLALVLSGGVIFSGGGVNIARRPLHNSVADRSAGGPLPFSTVPS